MRIALAPSKPLAELAERLPSMPDEAYDPIHWRAPRLAGVRLALPAANRGHAVAALLGVLVAAVMGGGAFALPPQSTPSLSAGSEFELVPPIIAAAVLGMVGLGGLGSAAIVLYRRAKRAVQEVHRLESLFDVLDEGIVVCSGMQVVTVNTSLCRLLGSDAGALQGAMISSLLGDSDAINRLLAPVDVHLETELKAADGTAIPVEITARTIPYSGMPRRLMEIRDIRERKAAQQHISFLAHYDPLTSLPNREMLTARVTESIERARTNGQRCALIWIDLDQFKEINDDHGHVAGDRILNAVADTLRFELPADVMISRFGGDEFVVFYDQIGDATEVRLIGQQLRRLLNRSIALDERSIAVGASIGVAVFPDDATNTDDLLKNADLALHYAKAEGRARCRLFGDDIGRERQRRTALSEQLKAAIENGEIQAFFQPLVRTLDGTVAGFEALGRWFHPEFGAVPPGEFVKLAEETGLIGNLTDAILRQAIEAAQGWPDSVRVSVNVSPVQLNSELVDRVRDLITHYQFDPHRLELEVTEDVLIKDFAQAASMFGRLRALGIQVAMDDFGSGYTSMGNLRRLNFDRIKIDRIFTVDLPHHRRSAAIVRAMFVLARQLELDVTVEGVETEEQFAFLCAEGCAEVQGFLFSPPKPASAFADPGCGTGASCEAGRHRGPSQTRLNGLPLPRMAGRSRPLHRGRPSARFRP
jgi:diguanylate cyclase (GGDEF)-like protein/PAS domain S-box-containing protein